MDKKYYKGLYGIDGAMNAFAEYANEVLPEGIADKAVPEVAWFKRKYADGTIAFEPKLYPTAPNVTHVDSLGAAFINPEWRWCGYDMAANELRIAKRTLQKDIKIGAACYPDILANRAFFVPASYEHLKK